MRDFEYLEPASLDEATSLLAWYKDEASLIAGGTDVVVSMKQGRSRPTYVVSLTSIPGLDYVRFDEQEGLKIGALATIRTIERSPEIAQNYPIILQAASQFGNLAIRNVATLGGNLCSALPSADTAPGLIALSARARIVGPEGERIVPLEGFFTGSGSTVLTTGEILVEIQVPLSPVNRKGVYLKYGLRGVSDLQVVGVAVVMDLVPAETVCQDVRIVLGNVSTTPIRAREAEKIAIGQKMDGAVIDGCAEAASQEARPRAGSIRASAEYKKAMVRVFTERAMREAVA
jgi:carbon-monoxide dehydrogenase medium subunit